MTRDAKSAALFTLAVVLTAQLADIGPGHAQSVKAGWAENLVVTAPDSKQGEAKVAPRPAAPWAATIESAARHYDLPVEFLTRLLQQESSFFTLAVSRAGAQGIAQFMPNTATARGLRDPFDPFDPEKAIPAAAAYLAELRRQFGNLGLAAAAYNAGSKRIADWLSGHGELPAETQDYVLKITGRSAVDWAYAKLGQSTSVALKLAPVAAKPNAKRIVRGNEASRSADAQLCEALKDPAKRCIVQDVY